MFSRLYHNSHTWVELCGRAKKCVEVETNNIAKTHPEIVQQLTRQLHDWQEGVMNSLMEADYKQKDRR